MEDKVVAVPAVSGRPLWSFFGVCDGHGGDYVASYLEKHLPNIVAQVGKQLESSSSSSSSSSSCGPSDSSRFGTTSSVESDENTTPEDLKEVLRTVCSVADYDISKQKRMAVDKNETTGELNCKDSSGSTGVFCLITKSLIAVSNVGDSRALLAQWSAKPSGLGDKVHSPQFSATPARLNSGEIESENMLKSVLTAYALSVDHKFCIEAERERAVAAGAM